MSVPPLPRRVVHQGTVEAAGFFVAGAHDGRVLALWSPGTRVWRRWDGWLAVLAHPRAVRAETAPGLPLVEQPVAGGRALLGAPLTPRELAAVQPEPGEVLLIQAGRWLRAPLSGDAGKDPEDLSTWLAVDSFQVTPVRSLGAPAAVPQSRPDPLPDPDFRSRLDGVPPADPELASVIEALREGAGAGRPAPRHPRPSLIDLLRYGADGIRRAGGSFLSSFLSRRPGQRGPAVDRPREPSRALLSLRRLLSRLVLSTPLSRAIGHRYSAYIQRMVEMFESGDIESALRHAIPLDAGMRKLPPAFSLRPPSARQSLRIRPGVAPAASAVPFDLFADLQRLYRQTFQRLEAQGRIQEAAFLLAEILHAHEEAVAFLERHGQLQLAAEMAEARGLPAGLVVRQWFLAGERQRALRVARRTGAFGDALGRLERSGKHEEARGLRMLWASGLAGAGDFAAAVDVAWPVAEARGLSRAWIDRAIAQGGEVAGRMLARKAGVWPAPFAAIRDEVLELLESRDTERIAARLAFARGLLQGSKSPEAQVLARAAVRAVARDSTLASPHRMSGGELRKLVELAADGALRTDAPALELPAKSSWLARGEPLQVEIAAGDVGAVPAFDAAYLPDGRVAVALGEAGARLLNRSGRIVAELDQPAQHLVVSDHGDRAIALARRGETWRLARLDFAARRAGPWTDARLDAWAPDYDGALWYVAGPDGVVAVEVAGPRCDGPWGLSDLPGPVVAIARSATHASLEIAGKAAEVWTYQLPSLTLRSREAVPTVLGAGEQGLSARGELIQTMVETAEGGEWRLWVKSAGAPPLLLPFAGPLRLGAPTIAEADWAAVPVYHPGGLRIYLIYLTNGDVRATLDLARTTQAALRLTPGTLTVADDHGRVLVLDLGHGQVIRNLRL